MKGNSISDFINSDVSLEEILGRQLHPIEQTFVNSILENADLFGLVEEVNATAKSLISKDMELGREISVLESFNQTYLEWVK